MADDDERNDNGIIHFEGGIPVFNTRLNSLENKARESERRDGQYKEKQLDLNRKLVWFTGVLAAVSVLGGAISGWQAHIASNTVAEMAATRQQTKADNANAIIAQQGIAQSALQASNDNAQKAFDAALKQSRLDQRAWVGIDAIKSLPSNPEINKPWTLEVVLKNSGKTPAINIFMRNGSGPYREIPRVNATCQDATRLKESRTMIPPNGIFNIPQRIAGGTPLPDGWDQVIRDRGKLYIYGCVVYDDIFARSHWMTYCGVMDPKTSNVLPDLEMCRSYNDTGDGTRPQED